MEKSVAIQGLPGSYTSMALHEIYPNTQPTEIKYLEKFKYLFDAIKNGDVGHGVVAFSNTRIDAVHEPYMEITGHDNMYDYWIDGGVTIPVNHCLAMPEGGNVDTLKIVHTQEEARQQCDKFMYQLNGKVLYKPENDTALSAEIVAELNNKEHGAICSEQAAALYGLTVVRQAIQDDKINQTRFVSFVPYENAKAPLDADNSLTALTLSQKSGSLSRALEIIADYNVNLRTIKSRNIPDTPMQIDIITEMKIGVHDERMELIVEELAKAGTKLHIMGSYKETQTTLAQEPTDWQGPNVSYQEEVRSLKQLQRRLHP